MTGGRFPDRAAAAEALAGDVVGALGEAIDARDHATLVVPGGETPREFFAALARRPISWSRVTITLTDERWVDPSDPRSNEGRVRQSLLVGPAAAARFVPLKNSAVTAAAGVARCARTLARLPRPFDVAVVGMGEDGHFASLFPGSAALALGLAAGPGPLCVASSLAGGGPDRISLASWVLAAARLPALHFFGEAKWRTYERAAEDGDDEVLPLRSLRRTARDRLGCYWAP